MLCVPFWLVLNSSLVNITDFTWSKLRYLIFTKSKLRLFCSHSSRQGSSSCWNLVKQHATLMYPLACHWLCIELHTTLTWLCLPQLAHILPYACIVSRATLYHNTSSSQSLILCLPSIVTFLSHLIVKFLVFSYMVQHLFFVL